LNEKTDWDDLLRRWCRAGFQPGEFWSTTPRGYAAAMRGADDASDDRFNLVLFGAWRTEAFARVDKLQQFKTYLRSKAKSARDAVRTTAAEIAASLRDKPGAATTIVNRPRPKARKEGR
jgi:hypothetical protein